VVIGTPIDLRRVMTINKPTVRVKYELQVLGPVTLEQILEEFLKKGGKW
jgi:predicted GTPase